MSLIRRFGGRLPDFDAVVRRFPIPLAIMAAFTVWIIANNHSDVWSYRDADYIASGFVLAGYVAVIIKLIVERRKASRLISVIVGLGAALSAFILCYFARKLDFTALMAIGGAIIFLGNAAAWRSGRQDRNVWNFTHSSVSTARRGIGSCCLQRFCWGSLFSFVSANMALRLSGFSLR